MIHDAITYRFKGSAREITTPSGSHGTTFSFRTPHGNEIDFSVL